MPAAHTHPRRATRTMFIAFIWIDGNVVVFDLEIKHFPMTFHIGMAVDNPVIQAFADEDGKIDKLLALVGHEALFMFDNFTTNADLEWARILRIKEVKGKT